MAHIKPRVFLWLLLGLLLATILTWTLWPQPVPVDEATVVRGPMQVEVSDQGRTRIREIYQISAPVAGRLLRIERHPGDAVVGGKTIVATLLPTLPGFLDVRTHAQAEAAIKAATAARDLARAELRRANSELNFARADLQRAVKLAQTGTLSQVALERAHLSEATLAAQRATAESALKVKEYDLEVAKAQLITPGHPVTTQAEAGIPLIAPVSGQVLRVRQESEAMVAAGAPLFDIGDARDLEIVAELLSSDAATVQAGATATLTDWGGAPLKAKVRLVEPSGFTKISALGIEEQRVNVLLDVSRQPAGLLDGFRVIVHIVTWRADKVLQVPMTATFRHGDDWAVFLVRDGRAVLTPIQIGHSNDAMAEVLSGLQDGDRVIVHPGEAVHDRVRIKPRNH